MTPEQRIRHNFNTSIIDNIKHFKDAYDKDIDYATSESIQACAKIDELYMTIEMLHQKGHATDFNIYQDNTQHSQDKLIEVAETLLRTHSEHDPNYTLKDALIQVGII